jgi:hypothetical protein
MLYALRNTFGGRKFSDVLLTTSDPSLTIDKISFYNWTHNENVYVNRSSKWKIFMNLRIKNNNS